MTVCVAAIARNQTIIGASDRMLTAGNIEFEPPIAKLHNLTKSTCIMIAGDVSLQAEILHSVIAEVESDPNAKWNVSKIADIYYDSFERIRRIRAERAILHPLGLNLSDLPKLQGELGVRIGSDMLNFEVPIIEALITGRDDTGAHIYQVNNNGTSCQDWVAFASIGVGADHANSQLMFAGHNRYRDFAATLFLVYSAKKRAEIAPGVGKSTDMFFIEPPDEDDKSYFDVGLAIIDNVLDVAYQEMRSATDDAREQGIGRINEWFQSLTQQSDQTVEVESRQPKIGAGTSESDAKPPANEEPD